MTAKPSDWVREWAANEVADMGRHYAESQNGAYLLQGFLRARSYVRGGFIDAIPDWITDSLAQAFFAYLSDNRPTRKLDDVLHLARRRGQKRLPKQQATAELNNEWASGFVRRIAALFEVSIPEATEMFWGARAGDTTLHDSLPYSMDTLQDYVQRHYHDIPSTMTVEYRDEERRTLLDAFEWGYLPERVKAERKRLSTANEG